MSIQNTKKLNLHDIPYEYDYDVINCFEHPIASIINYFDRSYTSSYIALAKFRGIYTQGNIRKLVLNEMKELFGIEVFDTSKLTYKMIIENLDKNIPMLVGVNLKQIFYSEHYMNKNWGHWLLIKGYNRLGELVSIFDNTQYEYSGHEYGTFHLPFELLKKANDDYKKVFGKEYAVLGFRQEKTIEPIHVLKYILSEFIKIDLSVEKNYKQMELLGALRSLIGEENIDVEYYGNELKKKLINVNKYRKLFQSEIERFMQMYEYESSGLEEYKNQCIELNNLWEIFIMKKTVETVRGRFLDIGLDTGIIEKEKKIQQILTGFSNYMEKETETILSKGKSKSYESDIQKEENTISYVLENNEDAIITGNDEQIEFYFQGKRTYNWWDMDEAPKVLLQSGLPNQRFTIRLILKIDSCYNAKNHEAGIFIRNRKTGQSLILGLENEENIVLDETEITGHKLFVGQSEPYSLFLKNRAGILECGLQVSDTDEVFFTHEYGSMEDSEIGLVCKTWGKGGKLRVTFQEIEFNGK